MTVDAACRAPAAFDTSLRVLIGAGDLAPRAREILRTRDAVFDGFKPEWLAQNLKFDVSISSGEGACPSARFSYNNYGEVRTFREKIGRVFGLYPGAYDTDVLASVLDIMQPTTDRHQTTLGFEWTASSPQPRIKLYFEELHHGYSFEQRREFAAAILRAAKDTETRVPDESIAAIAVDFLPGKELTVKLYSMFKTIDEILAAVDAPPALSRHWRRTCDVLSLEKRCFYYLTRRLHDGELQSLKLYKIYEFAQFSGFDEPLREIRELFGRWGRDKDAATIAMLQSVCRKESWNLYPVIASLDTGKNGVGRADAYFAMRPEAVQ